MYGAGDVNVAHAPNEHVSIAALMTATKTVACLLADWCGVGGEGVARGRYLTGLCAVTTIRPRESWGRLEERKHYGAAGHATAARRWRADLRRVVGRPLDRDNTGPVRT